MGKSKPVMIHSATLPLVVEVQRTKRDPTAIVVLKAGPRPRKRRSPKR